MSEKKKTTVKEVLEENQKLIIQDKEKFYDKIIDKCHLDAKKMDIIIVGLLLLMAVCIILGIKFS